MIFVANYKMNGNKNFYKKVNKVVNKLKTEDTIILCPPFVYMPFFKIKQKNLSLGSQDISDEMSKKATGQISPVMLNEFGASFAIVGHSERRADGETDEQIASKINLAQTYGIVPIVCVGEKLKSASLDILAEQVKSALSKALQREIIFAYEPVWAIGSGEVPTNEQIDRAIEIIKNTAKSCEFNVKVLYGGSVNLSNAKELSNANIDGFLMGGVSLKLEEFIKIVKGE